MVIVRSDEAPGDVDVRGTGGPRRSRSSTATERRAGLGLSTPALVVFAVFWFIPLVATVYLSFTSYDLARPPKWVGLTNYQRMFSDPVFWSSLRVTVIFTLLSVGPTIILGLLLALPLTKASRTVSVIRALLFVPAILPLVASALLWLVIYQTGGLADHVVGLFGIAPQPWLTEPNWAIVCVGITLIWKYVAFFVIIFMAGLQGIPQNLYEAAALDGARGVRTFFFITVPQLKRTFLFVIIIGVTGSVQSLVPSYLITKGGPVDATQVVALYLYNNAFSYSKFGYAAAIAIVLLVVLLALALLQFKLVDEPED
jgi:multiple sugar transport system permease protein